MHHVDIMTVETTRQALWTDIGCDSYHDEPDFAPGNILWPDIETIDNRDQFLHWIAFSEGKGIGRCMVKSSDRVEYATLLDICVVPEYRRQGVGRQLLQTAEEASKGWGKTNLRIMSDIDDEELKILPFFIKAGFSFSDGHSVLIDATRPLPQEVLSKNNKLEEDHFQIRRLNKDSAADVELAVRLHKQYFPVFPGFMTPEEAIGILLEKDFIFLVSERYNTPAGFVLGKENTTTHHYRHVRKEGIGLLSGIATCDEFRGRGIASSLIVGLMKEIRNAGNTKLLYGRCGMGSPSMRLAIHVGGVRIVNHICLDKQLKP